MRSLLGFDDVQRASLWRRLSAMERAGIPIQVSVGRLVDQGGEGLALTAVRADLAEGLGMDEAFGRAGALSPLERRLIGAATKGGRLPEVLDDLAEHFDDRAATKRALVASLAYPVFLMHAAVFFPSLPVLVTDGLLAFIAAVLLPIAAVYGVIGAVVLGWRALRAADPLAADRRLLALPVAGAVVHKRALATSLNVLRLLHASGVPAFEALEAAGAACPNAEVGRAFDRVREALGQGLSMGQAFAGEPLFPPEVVDVITTGETSGQLDDLLLRATRRLEDEAKLARRALIVVAGLATFSLAAGLVAWKIFSFWSGYLDAIRKAF
ncbi:MAG: type II secretion system F family protein [Planctomycetes bacterium]|nr:type II secretion system F family protein [Planctomycetota bacterium]